LDDDNKFNLKLSIGIPVFNGEKFLRQCLDSLLTQTFANFELIISDNASDDSTSDICNEYSKKFKNFRYFKHKKNMGIKWNFNFVLEQAKCNYFIWVAVDDILLPNFLKKNLEILESQQNLVGCVSKIKPYDLNDLKISDTDEFFKNVTKQLRTRFRKRGTYSIKGTYDEKVRFYLKKSTCQIIYGIFKTNVIRKSIIIEEFEGSDWCINLNILKQGDFHVIDEVLMLEFEGGLGSRGTFRKSVSSEHQKILGIFFPWMPFTLWCSKKLGLKLFLKNFDYFLRLNFEGVVSQILDFSRIASKNIQRIFT
jgi:glycosyltransferase involved in cell wall biosynthesis